MLYIREALIAREKKIPNKLELSFSVIIPCFNSEDTIERAITCALKQTYKPMQLIIIGLSRILSLQFRLLRLRIIKMEGRQRPAIRVSHLRAAITLPF